MVASNRGAMPSMRTYGLSEPPPSCRRILLRIVGRWDRRGREGSVVSNEIQLLEFASDSACSGFVNGTAIPFALSQQA